MFSILFRSHDPSPAGYFLVECDRYVFHDKNIVKHELRVKQNWKRNIILYLTGQLKLEEIMRFQTKNILIILFAVVAFGSLSFSPGFAAVKLNIVVIMSDDIGWFNIGAYHRGMISISPEPLETVDDEILKYPRHPDQTRPYRRVALARKQR
jgi:hypothetical protein